MRTKIIVSSFVCLCLISLLSVSSLAAKKAPGKFGFWGKGNIAKAAFGDPNPDAPNITLPNGSAAVGGGIENKICVYPTAEMTANKTNIQWAVDNVAAGGTVVLKPINKGGTFTPFNLPTTTLPTISITRAMTVEGEPYGSGKTEINGGFGTFLVNAYGSVVDFKMLKSSGAHFIFLAYKACTGATIEDIDVFGGIYKMPSETHPWGTFYSVYITTALPIPPYPSPTDRISGNIKISKCLFDNSSMGDLGANLAVAVLYTDADMSVVDCNFKNIGNRSIEIAGTSGEAKVQRNQITSNLVGPIYFMRNERQSRPIHVTCLVDDPSRQIHPDISNNIIDIRPKKYDDLPVEFLGIYLAGGINGRIEKNTIYVNPGENKLTELGTCVFQFASSEGVICSDNTVSGEAQTGFMLGLENFFGSNYPCKGITIEGNNLSGLTAEAAQLYISGHSSGNYIGPDANGVKNKFGPIAKVPATNAARIRVEGHDNIFEYNEYHGEVRPWEEGHGIWLMRPTSYNNSVKCPTVFGELKPGRTLYDYYKDQSGQNIQLFKPFECSRP